MVFSSSVNKYTILITKMPFGRTYNSKIKKSYFISQWKLFEFKK